MQHVQILYKIVVQKKGQGYTGYNRNTSHILNDHLCGASELRQMVAPSS